MFYSGSVGVITAALLSAFMFSSTLCAAAVLSALSAPHPFTLIMLVNARAHTRTVACMKSGWSHTRPHDVVL